MVACTGATTGRPIGVCLSHEPGGERAPDGTDPGDLWPRKLLAVSRWHSYGMTCAMNLPVTLGSTMILLPEFDVEQVLDYVKSYRPTFLPGVPAMYQAISHAPRARAYGLDAVKACLSGGSPLPVEVEEEFEKVTRGRLIEGYGLTEASPLTHAKPLSGARKAGSAGVPISNTRAKIIDPRPAPPWGRARWVSWRPGPRSCSATGAACAPGWHLYAVTGGCTPAIWRRWMWTAIFRSSAASRT